MLFHQIYKYLFPHTLNLWHRKKYNIGIICGAKFKVTIYTVAPLWIMKETPFVWSLGLLNLLFAGEFFQHLTFRLKLMLFYILHWKINVSLYTIMFIMIMMMMVLITTIVIVMMIIIGQSGPIRVISPQGPPSNPSPPVVKSAKTQKVTVNTIIINVTVIVFLFFC